MSNIKVNINRPEVSSDEIASKQDFSSVVKNYKSGNTTTTTTTKKSIFKKPGFISTVVVTTTVVVATATYSYFKKTEKSSQAAPVKTEKTIAAKAPAATANKTMAKKAVISPPLKNVNVKYNSYKVNATKGGEITHTTGSKITVPANAFVDKSGKAVKGDVEIRYREFHDVPSIFVSGIPMTYDSAGTRYHFESSGMMDIQGYQGDEKISIAPDKKLKIEMVSKNAESKYNLYSFDEEQGNWTYLGKPEIKRSSAQEGSDGRLVSRSSVLSELEKRKATMQNVTENVEERIQQEKPVAEIIKKQAEVKKVIAKMEKEERPAKPRKANDDRYRFNIEFDKKEFPELMVYSNTMFEVDPNNKSFTEAMYKIDWDDAKLDPGPSGKPGMDYFLTLTTKTDKVKLMVYPVFEGKSYEQAEKEFAKKFEAYNQRLEKRKEDEKRLQQEYEAKVAEYKKKYDEMARQWGEERLKQMNSQIATGQVMNVFYASSFKIYNCDNPRVYPSGADVMAKLECTSGKIGVYAPIYLAEKGKNAMFTIVSMGELYKICYNPEAKNVLWTVTDDQKLAVLTSDDFNKNIRATDGKVKMNVLDIPINDAAIVKRVLGL